MQFNPVQPFPALSEVSVGDVRAPVLYYFTGWLLICIRRDRDDMLDVRTFRCGHTVRDSGWPSGLECRQPTGQCLCQVNVSSSAATSYQATIKIIIKR